jgi:hypothetical protein
MSKDVPNLRTLDRRFTLSKEGFSYAVEFQGWESWGEYTRASSLLHRMYTYGCEYKNQGFMRHKRRQYHLSFHRIAFRDEKTREQLLMMLALTRED